MNVKRRGEVGGLGSGWRLQSNFTTALCCSASWATRWRAVNKSRTQTSFDRELSSWRSNVSETPHMSSGRTFAGWAPCLYLLIFSIDIHFLGADGIVDVVNVVFSAVVKDVLVLLPESHRRRNSSRSVRTSHFYQLQGGSGLFPPFSKELLGETPAFPRLN